MNNIVPGILENNYSGVIKLISDYSKITTSIQVDVCDGVYTPYISWLPNKYEDINGFNVDLEFDMMVVDVRKYLDLLFYYDAKKIIIHIHNYTDEEYRSVYDYIKKKNKLIKVGVAINAKDSLSRITDNIDMIDYVQVMTIDNIGVQHEPLSSIQLEKLKMLCNFFNMNDIRREVQVDGAIDGETLLRCKEAGATSFVIGHYIKESKDRKKTLTELMNL